LARHPSEQRRGRIRTPHSIALPAVEAVCRSREELRRRHCRPSKESISGKQSSELVGHVSRTDTAAFCQHMHICSRTAPLADVEHLAVHQAVTSGHKQANTGGERFRRTATAHQSNVTGVRIVVTAFYVPEPRQQRPRDAGSKHGAQKRRHSPQGQVLGPVLLLRRCLFLSPRHLCTSLSLSRPDRSQAGETTGARRTHRRKETHAPRQPKGKGTRGRGSGRGGKSGGRSLRREAVDGEGVVHRNVHAVAGAVNDAQYYYPLVRVDKTVPDIYECHHSHLCVCMCVCMT
jgi:hypothetical protein